MEQKKKPEATMQDWLHPNLMLMNNLLIKVENGYYNTEPDLEWNSHKYYESDVI